LVPAFTDATIWSRKLGLVYPITFL
jgi:hypothetical protein